MAHPSGGDNPALAEEIARKYGGILLLKHIIKEEWKSQLSACVLCISSHSEPLFIVTLSFLSPISSHWNTRGQNFR